MVKKNDRRLGTVVEELLQKIQLESNPVRQADALLLLFEAVFYEPSLRDVVLDALLRAYEQMNSWKRPYILSDVARVFAIDDLNRAAQIIELIGEGRWNRKTRREIAARQWLGPHEFFPNYANGVLYQQRQTSKRVRVRAWIQTAKYKKQGGLHRES